MDPFDEFEFKPLTEGLGFHNKKNPESFSAKTNSEALFIEETIAEQKPTATFLVKNPLPRETKQEANLNFRNEVQNRSSETVDQILRTLNEKKKYDFVEAAKNLRSELPPAELKNSCFELSAGILDFMLITAGFLMSMIILLVVTKADLVANLMNPDEGNEIYYGVAGLFALVVWIYLVVNRMFLGFTPGEWVFDQQVGRNQELGSGTYSMRVALRSLLVIATGFLPLPILSMLTRIDLAGKISGAQIFKKA